MKTINHITKNDIYLGGGFYTKPLDVDGYVPYPRCVSSGKMLHDILWSLDRHVKIYNLLSKLRRLTINHDDDTSKIFDYDRMVNIPEDGWASCTRDENDVAHRVKLDKPPIECDYSKIPHKRASEGEFATSWKDLTYIQNIFNPSIYERYSTPEIIAVLEKREGYMERRQDPIQRKAMIVEYEKEKQSQSQS